MNRIAIANFLNACRFNQFAWIVHACEIFWSLKSSKEEWIVLGLLKFWSSLPNLSSFPYASMVLCNSFCCEIVVRDWWGALQSVMLLQFQQHLWSFYFYTIVDKKPRSYCFCCCVSCYAIAYLLLLPHYCCYQEDLECCALVMQLKEACVSITTIWNMVTPYPQ